MNLKEIKYSGKFTIEVEIILDAQHHHNGNLRAMIIYVEMFICKRLTLKSFCHY
jgi:hypothetical protein